ncbi:17071_t:CDS:1, partial [Acaulospora colombiana]
MSSAASWPARPITACLARHMRRQEGEDPTRTPANIECRDPRVVFAFLYWLGHWASPAFARNSMCPSKNEKQGSAHRIPLFLLPSLPSSTTFICSKPPTCPELSSVQG